VALRTGYLGLGANVGDRRANLQAAVDALAAHGVEVLASSCTYDTDPVGEILDQPAFLNACLRVRTALEPEALLDAAKAVERELGREAGGPRDGPRPIDVDVLLLGDVEHASERLRLPHEQVLARRFVLVPLLELDFDLATPSGERLADVLGALPVHEGVRRAGPPLKVPRKSDHRPSATAAAEAASGRRSAAEEARTVVASTNVGALATLSDGGEPWSSLVVFGTLGDGAPVLLLSTMAEHGRNLRRDPRASLSIADPAAADDPLEGGRVTLAGRVVQPSGEHRSAALAAHVAAVPGAELYAEWEDFTLWVLEIERVRWVGGFARMDSVGAEDYAAAEPDPTAPSAARAVAHLNDDHGAALLAMARRLAGRAGATSATCTAIDRYGLDLSVVDTETVAVRIAFAEPAQAGADLRPATVELARRARAE
jgi:2-amino-4-hydroxy-6-hydroxymethyldihydropteridine diphosphokinase